MVAKSIFVAQVKLFCSSGSTLRSQDMACLLNLIDSFLFNFLLERRCFVDESLLSLQPIVYVRVVS